MGRKLLDETSLLFFKSCSSNTRLVSLDYKSDRVLLDSNRGRISCNAREIWMDVVGIRSDIYIFIFREWNRISGQTEITLKRRDEIRCHANFVIIRESMNHYTIIIYEE